MWKERIKELLQNGLKYCFKPPYPEIDMTEFKGTEDEPGFIDAVYSAINYERRIAFFHGYGKGAADACIDLGKGEAFDINISNIGAWRAWEKSEREK